MSKKYFEMGTGSYYTQVFADTDKLEEKVEKKEWESQVRYVLVCSLCRDTTNEHNSLSDSLKWKEKAAG